jgi:hypothetical protein
MNMMPRAADSQAVLAVVTWMKAYQLPVLGRGWHGMLLSAELHSLASGALIKHRLPGELVPVSGGHHAVVRVCSGFGQGGD